MFRIPWTWKDDGVWWFTEYRSRYCYFGRRVPRQSTRNFYWSLHERSYARPREEIIFSTVCPGSTVSRSWSFLSWRRLTTAPSLVSHGVGVVLRSEHSKVKAGDHVYGMLGMFGQSHLRFSINVSSIKNTRTTSLRKSFSPSRPSKTQTNYPGLPSSVSSVCLVRRDLIKISTPGPQPISRPSGKTAFMAWREYSQAKKVNYLTFESL